MAAKHTTNYGLNLWEPSDSFLRTEFNENTQKIDAALGQKANASALNALAQTVSAKGNCTIISGSYTGTGEAGEEHPCTLDFAKSVGRPPLFLYVSPADSSDMMLLACRGQTEAYPGRLDKYWGYSLIDITWTATGVSWSHYRQPAYQMNEENTVYHYIVLL